MTLGRISVRVNCTTPPNICALNLRNLRNLRTINFPAKTPSTSYLRERQWYHEAIFKRVT